MAIFGRKTARQRLRRAARQSLTIPAFSAPVDCTPWVLGDLWPAELATITAETATLAEYLDADLQRIANSANEKLQAISRAGLAGLARQAAEARVINVARAFAVLRVESTVRQLRKEALEFRVEHLSLNPAEQTPQEAPDTTERLLVDSAEYRPTEQHTERHLSPPPPPAADPEVIVPGPRHARYPSDLVVIENVEEAPTDEPAEAESGAETTDEPAESESGEQRLRRLLEFVARQEPGLRWAIGAGADGSTVLVTDLAHGWIPSGIELPAGVQLLEPGWRDGNAAALLGPTTLSATYAPGDRLEWATELGPTEPSPRPRELPMVDDLGWVLAEATHWRDGLPRIANTLAKAGAAGTGVADAEIDLLRVHLDTARYQLMAQYPDVDIAPLLNCMLLAATEGIAAGDEVSANYHFAWFQALSAPAASRWAARS
ncbi:MAG: DUF5631 domain-containing protein [Mycobacterium sp.]